MDYIFSKKSQCKLCEIERKHARVPLSLRRGGTNSLQEQHV